jgi:hypothetical protein
MLPRVAERATRHLFARLELGDLAGAAIADWGVACLGEGLDTPSLRVAAGFGGASNAFEALDHLERACHELGVVFLRGGQALESEAGALMLDLLEDRIGIREATTGVYRVLRQLHFPAHLAYWYDLDDAFRGAKHLSAHDLAGEAAREAREWLAAHPLPPLDA